MSKNAVFVLPFFITGLVGIVPVLSPNSVQGDYLPASQVSAAITVGSAELLAINYTGLKSPSIPENQKPLIIKTLITAYSSSVDETDDTPFITASGSYTRDGIVAANFLPIGTRIRIPTIFGPKVFIVEDRLRSDYNDRIDIWFSTKGGALEFGKKTSHIEVL